MHPRGTTDHWYDSTTTRNHPSLRTNLHNRSVNRASSKVPPVLGPRLPLDENGARLQHLPKLRQNLRLQNLQNPSCKPRCYHLSCRSPVLYSASPTPPLCPTVLLSKLTHPCPNSELPGPTRQSLPLQRRRECIPRRSHRTQHDDWQTHSAGYFVLAVQGYGGMEVR